MNVKCSYPWHNFLVELAFLAGVILQLNAFFSPVLWFYRSSPLALVTFEPYSPPDGYSPSNLCSDGNQGMVSIPKGVKYTGYEESRRTWAGYLGTCTRDDDSRVFCTPSSVSFPRWNLTYIQDNNVFNSYTTPPKVETIFVLISVTCTLLAFILFIWISAPFHFSPGLTRRFVWSRIMFRIFSVVILVCGVFSLVTIALATPFSQKDISRYMSVDNFYDPAPCDTPRSIKSGVLMQVRIGKAWKLLLAGWVLCFITAACGWIHRFIWTIRPVEASDK